MGNKPKTPGKAPAGGTLHSPTDKKIGKSKAGAKGHTAGSVEPMLPADAMSLEERIRQNRKQLQDVERQIFNLESQYFDNANPQGNAIRGYEGLLSSQAVSAKKAQFKPEDRIFSASSVTGQLL